ncbi:MAG: hypothetical protein QXS18_04940 [Thermoplasmata archaeon]
MFKIVQWLSVNIASIFGITQAVLKFLKEIITAILNLLSILMPSSKFIDAVRKAREIVNIIDSWIEKIKGFFLKTIV